MTTEVAVAVAVKPAHEDERRGLLVRIHVLLFLGLLIRFLGLLVRLIGLLLKGPLMSSFYSTLG